MKLKKDKDEVLEDLTVLDNVPRWGKPDGKFTPAPKNAVRRGVKLHKKKRR